ncbi:MAG: hypothetical protein J5988_07770 [Eubacterium sp.]|nr:hypothetical protein [Eubacterium sp.]
MEETKQKKTYGVAFAGEEETTIYNSFVKELTEWAKEGSLPESGNQDTAFYLELQQSRLKKRNIRMEYRFLPGKNQDSPHCVERKDGKYTNKMVFVGVNREICFFRGNSCKFRDKKDMILYQIITWLNDSSVNREEPYCCPNCSAVSPVKLLLTGCPYCGTRFQMTDLFPKVTDFFCLDDFSLGENEMEGMVKKAVIAGGGIGFLLNGLISLGGGFSLGRMIMMMVVFAFFGYMALSFALLCGLLKGSASAAPLLARRNDARKKITALLKQYDPGFSYEYFVNKMISSLKMILFSEDRSNLVVWQGEISEDAFRDIIDTAYKGAIGLNSYKVEGKYCYLDIDLYMVDIHDGSRIYKKDDVFRMKVCKDITKPEDYGFSIRKVQCRGCGGSFDASRIKYCPYCGREYDMKDDNWVVLDIK